MTDNKYKYNSWPIGKVPEEFRRKEPETIKQLGYSWSDPRDIVDLFENKIAKFANCKYAVLIDCCTNGLFLTLKYLQHIGEIKTTDTITIPSHTYASAPMLINMAGNKFNFENLEWSGEYQFKNTRIWDSAVRWTKNMYRGDDVFQVVSFQIKKRIPIGRGGVILTNDEKAAKWLKLASYDGRDLTTPYTHPEHIHMIGYHMYMTPEDAARGIILMDSTPEENEDSGSHLNYTDLSSMNIFKDLK